MDRPFVWISWTFLVTIIILAGCSLKWPEGRSHNNTRQAKTSNSSAPQVERATQQQIHRLTETNDKLEEDNQALNSANNKLTSRLKAVTGKNDRLEDDNHKLNSENAALNNRIDLLTGENPPAWNSGKNVASEIVISKLYSIRTGDCFDTTQASSCGYATISDAEGVTYLVYKYNFSFSNASEMPNIFDKQGKPLTLVSPQGYDQILAWENASPSNVVKSSRY